MNCDVVKLRKAAWTNDDPKKIDSSSGGIFFSIWVSNNSAASTAQIQHSFLQLFRH